MNEHDAAYRQCDTYFDERDKQNLINVFRNRTFKNIREIGPCLRTLMSF